MTFIFYLAQHYIPINVREDRKYYKQIMKKRKKSVKKIEADFLFIL